MPTAIKLRSAGAVKPGLIKVIDAFSRETSCDVDVNFATAPALLKEIRSGALVDIVIAPAAVLDELGKLGKVSQLPRATLGRIGVGIMVRDDGPLPKIATVDELKESLLDAESIVYNQASTGTYLEALFERLGIANLLIEKTTRYPDFAAVLDHVSKGNGREFGFGATTVIIENANKGVKFAGPLPAEIQNYTEYAAALTTNRTAEVPAQQFMDYIANAISRSLLTSAGID
jgi:molybdate transport system substrate-binding protein